MIIKPFLFLGIVLFFSLDLMAKEPSRTFKVTYSFDLQYDEKQFPAKLWNPLPLKSDYQQVRSLTFDGNYDYFNLNRDNQYDANIFYVQWDKSEKPKKVTLKLIIETKERTVDLKRIVEASAKNLPLPKGMEDYINATEHIPTSGIVGGLAKRITRDKTDRFEKVKAIYGWCTSHTFRDSKVLGCGSGDVNKLVTQKEVEDAYKNGYYGGKCTDLSSLFVALVRAVGIPAREVFGMRLGKSHFSKALGKSDAQGRADISTWQHCRAEYFIPGVGWVPTDPADITKLMLVEGLKYSDPKVQALKDKYLHSWEMNWVGFNYGRDFILSPKPEQYPINMLGYPYGEVDGDVLNYYDPKEFGFSILSQEIK